MKISKIQSLRKRGFALVVTLSLMILLTIIAVGLLSLSSITLRATSVGASQAIANSNAKLALMLAIGDLQKTLGPDQGVTAPAKSVINDAKRPHLLGAWQSWHWTPTQGGSPSYGEKQKLFRGWLVSAATPANGNPPSLDTGDQPSGVNAINLVGSSTAPLTDSQGKSVLVMAEKVKVGKTVQPGKYAWAVFDDSVKAPIHLNDPNPALTSTTEAASRTAPARVRADILAPTLTGLVKPVNMISLETGAISSGPGTAKDMRRHFHDFTTGSIGLLTDTAKGGLKTDLTSLFEDTTATLPGNTLYFNASSGAPTWAYLRDHYLKYQTITNGSNGTPSYKPTSTDLKIIANGLTPSPVNERLLPVIAKCQIVFSIVAHNAHFPGRIKFHNNKGTPVNSNDQFAVPHLVYEPIFTIHNPYDVSLKLDRLRVRIWDPPVKFRFEKLNLTPRPGETAGANPFRSDNASFFTLGQFQRANQDTTNARRAFTFLLTDGTAAAAGTSLTLLPGEVKVFSARVEDNWTWGMEIASNRRSFFDYEYVDNFGNIDKRTLTTSGTPGKFGVEAVPGWDARAGLQTDHLSNDVGKRPDATLYDFEKKGPGPGEEFYKGYISMRLTDKVHVQAKPEIIGANPFRIDILAGKTVGNVNEDVAATNVGADMLRSFTFSFANITQEVCEDPGNSMIDRTFTIQNILQKSGDTKPEGKTPFAMLEMSARTTKDPLTDSKPWLYNNHLVEGAQQIHNTVGVSNQSYDVRFREMNGSFNDFPGIEVDPDTFRGFSGASSTESEGGSSFVTMARVPLAPAASLGDLIGANLVAGSTLPRVVHPLGNSRAHPLIASDKINNGAMLDHTYLINDALWDSYYFSSVADYKKGIFDSSSDSRDRSSVLKGIFDGSKPAINPRIIPIIAAGDPKATAEKIDGLTANGRATQLAKNIGISGPFNLNSTSVEAWVAVLSSLRDRTVTGWSNKNFANSSRIPFTRATMPLAGAAEGLNNPSSAISGKVRWAGYRSLDDTQIKDLAERIVEQITLRGVEDQAPSLSLAEFVNRRVGGSGTLQAQAGILQSAIDKSALNAINHSQDSRPPISSGSIVGLRKKGAINTDAMDGYSGEGAPSSLTQGDLMAALAPIATVRGDTFKIRCYGEALAKDGTTILASAWCEATVQRFPDFVDAQNAPETAIASLNDTNKTFGRHFQIVSFRWLAKDEI